MELVSPGIGLIFWMTLSFAILLWILAKFAWKPILNAIKDREGTIERSLLTAVQVEGKMKALETEHEELLSQAKDERDEILHEARTIKNSIIEEAGKKASEEADRIMESARESIINEKKAVMTDLKNQLVQLSIDIAEKLLREELSKTENQKELVKKLINEARLN